MYFSNPKEKQSTCNVTTENSETIIILNSFDISKEIKRFRGKEVANDY